jgi:hypothetical protein
LAQSPLPLQKPVLPQESGFSVAHSLPGSWPATTGWHTPSAPCPFFAAEHAWHVPVHGKLQHTPSTQLPLAHSSGELHGSPSGLGAQRPAVQIEVLQSPPPMHFLPMSQPWQGRPPPQSTSVSLPFCT